MINNYRIQKCNVINYVWIGGCNSDIVSQKDLDGETSTSCVRSNANFGSFVSSINYADQCSIVFAD